MYVTKSIDILNKNTPGVKKGKAKSEAPKVTLMIYSTKKIDIMQVVHKRMLYIRTNLRMFQHSNNVECNIRMFNTMQQNDVFW